MTQPRLVGARYELGELIGYGGMAEVHRGRDARLGRDVAIKVLRADLARDPSFINRFRREAQAAAGLNHPSIVSVYDTGEDNAADGTSQPFIVMEFVEGRTLRDVLKLEGRLHPRRAMEIVADICGALDFSHRNGIVHRDIKPANVMITHAGAVKVMDFGIARAVADSAATVTQTANVIGTAQYLSPEQARGEAVDARSDVYSTGCLLYELITGAPPFQGDSPVAVAYQHVRENPVPPSSRNPEVPAALDSIVMKALAKNQLNRYQSAGEMRMDLQRALANQPVAAEAIMTDAERTQFIARTPMPPVAVNHRDAGPMLDEEDDTRRKGLMWAAIVLGLLLVIGIAAYAILFAGNNKSTKKVTIPDVIGQVPSAAELTLKNLGLNPVKGDPVSSACDGGVTVPDGKVCTLDPPVGSSVNDGQTVTYHVFQTAQVQVPNVVGQDYETALVNVQNAGLKVKKALVDSTEPVGQVVKQDPEAYASVPKGSTVTLSVSNGKTKLVDVTGKKLDDAVKTLNGDGWTNLDTKGVLETQDPTKDGIVAQESPTPGVSYPLDTTIHLTVYRYVAPQTSTSPTSPSTSGSPTDTGSPTTPTSPPTSSTPAGGILPGGG